MIIWRLFDIQPVISLWNVAKPNIWKSYKEDFKRDRLCISYTTQKREINTLVKLQQNKTNVSWDFRNFTYIINAFKFSDYVSWIFSHSNSHSCLLPSYPQKTWSPLSLSPVWACPCLSGVRQLSCSCSAAAVCHCQWSCWSRICREIFIAMVILTSL